jgi:Flp pilus assembly protein TadD
VTRLLIAVSLVCVLTACGGGLKELPSASTVQSEADVPAMLRIGDRLLANGDVTNAVQLYNDALTKEPANVEILMRLGNVAWRLGAFEDAAGYYGQALSVDPENASALMGRARTMMAQDNPVNALRLIEQIERQKGETVETLSAKGLALDLLGRQEDAQVAYSSALDISPDSTLTRANMALSFAISEDYHAAIDIVRGLNDIPAEADRAREVLSLIYALSGQVATAVELSGDATQRAFYTRLPHLSPAAKAVAVFFHRLPKFEPPPPVVDFIEPESKKLPPEPLPDTRPKNVPTPEQQAISTSEQPKAHYWAQVASFRAVAAVEIAWADIAHRLPDLSRKITPMVQSFEAEDRPTTHRLMVGRFATSAEAIERCETLRAAKIDCVVIRNDIGATPLSEAIAKP